MTGCPICDSTSSRALPATLETRLVLCRRCGFVYRPDRPAMAEVAAEARGHARHYTEVAEPGETCRERARALADWLRGVLPERASLLEIASADTSLLGPLAVLLPAGTRLRGVDLGDFAGAAGAAPASEWTGSAWRRAPVHDVQHDVVVLPYTLQRLPDFVAALAAARAALAPGGVLYLECSNLLTPHPKKRLRAWIAAQRWGCFSMARLEDALARAGLRAERKQSGATLRVLARPSTAVTGPWQGESEVRRVVSALLWHEVRYWPPLVLSRVRARAQGLLARASGPGQDLGQA